MDEKANSRYGPIALPLKTLKQHASFHMEKVKNTVMSFF